MTHFMLIIICVAAPFALLAVTTHMSGAFTLPHPDAPPPSKSQRLRRYLLLNWPWICVPLVAAFAGYRLAQDNLSASSWTNLGMIILAPVCFALLLVQPWSHRRLWAPWISVIILLIASIALAPIFAEATGLSHLEWRKWSVVGLAGWTFAGVIVFLIWNEMQERILDRKKPALPDLLHRTPANRIRNPSLGRNVTTRRAETVASSPVLGLRPTRASLSFSRNVPNFEIFTFSPDARASVMRSRICSTICRASDFDRPTLRCKASARPDRVNVGVFSITLPRSIKSRYPQSLPLAFCSAGVRRAH